MSGEILIAPLGGAAEAGFFGKLPVTGDFVARGLPDSFRRAWDGWVSAHLLPRVEPWPEGGLRFRLLSGGRAAAGVVVPSQDRAGRVFPLSLILTADDLPGPAALDPWCAAALGLDRSRGPEALWFALDALPLPEGRGPATALLLWSPGVAPLAADPAAPGDALTRIFARA